MLWAIQNMLVTMQRGHACTVAVVAAANGAPVQGIKLTGLADSLTTLKSIMIRSAVSKMQHQLATMVNDHERTRLYYCNNKSVIGAFAPALFSSHDHYSSS